MPEFSPPTDAGLPDEHALRDLLRGCAATRALADGRLSPIAGGLSNRAWRLDTADATWFVRRGHPGAVRLGVDRHSECVVLQVVAAAGLAPQVLACEPRTQLLVTRFVVGATWQAGDVAEEANLRRVAQRLRQLHDLPVPAGVQAVDYARQAQRLEAGLTTEDPQNERLRTVAGQTFARLHARARTTSLCHHDLHHLNLLDDGTQLWLVDWEYAGRGDPLLDVAGFLALHRLGAEATARFVAAYGRLDAADRDRLEDARWAFDYVQWLWYRSRFPESAADPDGPAVRLKQRLLHCDNRPLGSSNG